MSSPSRSSELWSWRTLVGVSSLAVMLLLTSPGVQVARAEQGAQAPAVAMSLEVPAAQDPAGSEAAESAPICEPRAVDPNQPSAEDVAAALAALQEQGSSDVVSFDGTGHNYRTGQDPLGEIQRIREEMRRERVRARTGR